jgi:ribosomal protein S8
MDILSKFASNFNNSVKSRSKSLEIAKSQTTYTLLKLFYKNGYILSFSSFNDKYVVYLNHSSINFYMKRFSRFSNNFTYNFSILKKSSNRGFCYVLKTPSGFFFSDSLLMNKFSGSPVYKLEFFALK